MVKKISEQSKVSNNFFKKTNPIMVVFIIFFILLFLPTPNGLSIQGHRALAVFALTIILWITRALPLPITSLLACVVLVLTGVIEPKNAFSAYGHEAVFFLLGAFMLGIAIMKHNLHKRMALKILEKFGKNTSMLLLGVILTCGFLSMLIPEHAVAALMLPVVIGIVGGFGVFSLFKTNFSKALFLGLAYGCSIGSLGTFMGGARNILAVSILKESTGQSISFFQWSIAAIPIVLLMFFFTWLLLKKLFPHEKKLDIIKARKEIHNEVTKLGKMDLGAKKTLIIFLISVILWTTLAHKLGLATIAILSAILLFITKTITWEDAKANVRWSLILLYGGAIALGKSLVATGAAEFISQKIVSVVGTNPYLILFVLAASSIYLTEFMSNSAAVATLLPIAIGIMALINFPPIVAMFFIALPAGLAFMFIIGTPGNAIAHSSGYAGVKDFLRAGTYLNIIGLVIFMTIGLTYWKLIGIY